MFRMYVCMLVDIVLSKDDDDGFGSLLLQLKVLWYLWINCVCVGVKYIYRGYILYWCGYVRHRWWMSECNRETEWGKNLFLMNHMHYLWEWV